MPSPCPQIDRRPVLGGLACALLFLGACGGDDFDFTGLNRNAIRPGIVEGFVRDLDAPGTPVLPNIQVELTPETRTTRTDANGFYRFEGLLPGPYLVTAIRPGNTFGDHAASDVLVVADQTAQANIEFGLGSGVENAQQIAYLSTNGTNTVFFATTTGTDTSMRSLGSIPAPLVQCRHNRAQATEFVCEGQTAGNSGVYLQDPVLGTTSPVIDQATPETHPDLHPDGSRVVYAGDKDSDGNFEIYLINRDGSGETLLVDDFDPATGGTFDNRDPDWSPDGVTILFVARRTDLLATGDERDYEVLSVRQEGGPIQVLTQDLVDDRDPTWHPDSTTILYAKQAGGFFQLFVSTAQISTPEVPLTNNFVDDREPTVSVDGRFVAWITRSNPDGTNIDGSAEVAVASLVGTALQNPVLRTANAGTITLSSPDFRPIVPR